MAVVKEIQVNKTADIPIRVICPICKKNKRLYMPKERMNPDGITNSTIPKSLVCEHTFQVLLDSNCSVRGYQRVDYEFPPAINKKKGVKKIMVKSENDLFENLILDGNRVEWRPKEVLKEVKIPSSIMAIQRKIEIRQEEKEKTKKGDNMDLEAIYNEFWEFIDEDNEEFKEFIINDNRRKTLKILY